MTDGERIIEEICKGLEVEDETCNDSIILWKLRGLSKEEIINMINVNKTGA